MTIKEYQEACDKTAIYPNKWNNFAYTCFGLASEVGEICGKYKKVLRDYDGKMTREMLGKIKDELGDSSWYLAQCCTELGISLEDVMKDNIAKLKDRQERGKLSGDGDNR